MATKSDGDAERLKEIIHLLNAALGECHKALGELVGDVRKSGQDNDRPTAH